MTTVRKLELGFLSSRSSTTHVIRGVIEEAGLEFINAEGVRRRSEDMVVYQGTDGLMAFNDDINQVVSKKGGDIRIVVASETMLIQLCGAGGYKSLERILTLNDTMNIKCILVASTDQPLSTPRFEFRYMSLNYIDPMPFYVYGDRFAIVVPDRGSIPKIVVIRSVDMAHTVRQRFCNMWATARTCPMIKKDGEVKGVGI